MMQGLRSWAKFGEEDVEDEGQDEVASMRQRYRGVIEVSAPRIQELAS